MLRSSCFQNRLRQRQKSRCQKQSGFTLMEVLVAITIFALIGVASYRVLSSVMQADGRIAARTEQMRVLNRALWIMQQDAEQIVRRNVRDQNGLNAAQDNYLLIQNDAELPLQFTRGGRSNPLGLPRTSMQRVAYAVAHHPDYEEANSPHFHEERTYLLRYTWSKLDGAGDKKQARTQIILPDVQTLTSAVLTEQGEQNVWPIGSGSSTIRPLALQFEIALKDGSKIKRAYKLW